MNIIQSGNIEINPTQDVVFEQLAVLVVASDATGNVEVVMESGTQITLSVDQIQQLYPKITKIVSTNTTVAGADIYLSFL